MVAVGKADCRPGAKSAYRDRLKTATSGPTEKYSKAAIAHSWEYFNGNKMKTTALVCLLSLFLFGCSDGPSDAEMRAAGRMFRTDMQTLIDSGGKVMDYQDGRRNANYYFLTLDAASFNEPMRKKYTDKLLDMGWRKINQSDTAEIMFCKDGAQASIANSGGTVFGVKAVHIDMVYTGQTIKECQQAERKKN